MNMCWYPYKHHPFNSDLVPMEEGVRKALGQTMRVLQDPSFTCHQVLIAVITSSLFRRVSFLGAQRSSLTHSTSMRTAWRFRYAFAPALAIHFHHPTSDSDPELVITETYQRRRLPFLFLAWSCPFG